MSTNCLRVSTLYECFLITVDEFLNQFGIGLGGTGPGLKLLSSVEAVRDSGWSDSDTG